MVLSTDEEYFDDKFHEVKDDLGERTSSSLIAYIYPTLPTKVHFQKK